MERPLLSRVAAAESDAATPSLVSLSCILLRHCERGMTPHQRNADYPGDEQLLSPHLAEGFAKGLLVQDAQVGEP